MLSLTKAEKYISGIVLQEGFDELDVAGMNMGFNRSHSDPKPCLRLIIQARINQDLLKGL